MSSLSKALSLENGMTLTAEDASRLFLERVISDKRRFICVDENCSALITCANMDKPIGKRKVDPYFRTVEEHSVGCELYKTQYQNTVDLGSEHVATEQNKDVTEPDTLFVLRPKGHFIEKRAKPHVEGVEIVNRKNSDKSSNSSINLSGSNFYHIGHVISRHHTYRSENSSYSRYIISEGDTRSYGQFFKHLKNLNYAGFPQVSSIYWGEVLKVFRLNNGDIKIDLSDRAKFENKPVFISIFIKKKDYEVYRFKRPIKENIEKIISHAGERFNVYVYGAPRLEVKEKVFIDFRPSSLDLLEIAEI